MANLGTLTDETLLDKTGWIEKLVVTALIQKNKMKHVRQEVSVEDSVTSLATYCFVFVKHNI